MIRDDIGSSETAFIDANIVVRYFVQDIPDIIDTIRRIIDDHPHLLITEGTIAEVGYVLTRRYTLPRHVVVDAIISLLQRRNIHVHQLDSSIVIQALLLCRPSGRVSFADAMLWATARSARPGATVYTLDRRFPASGITLKDEFAP